jgi:hypothetical protein
MVTEDGRVAVVGPAPPQQELTGATQPRPLGRLKTWQTDKKDQLKKQLRQRRFFHDLQANPGRSSFREDKAGLTKVIT